ncbi:MAG: hypothetical protein QM626_08575 [Microbacterium sp.]|uniref:hypothetical protein n=1 Tax=Microbacterium sp. TaxID=51671 RepID=UPI0039E42125
MFFLEVRVFAAPSRPHTKWGVAVAFGAAGSLVVVLIVLAFLWPTKTSAAHDLPVGIAGPEATVSAFEDALGEQGVTTFDFVAADDREDAVSQIETRETYGAIVFSDTGMPEVLTAPAASSTAASLLTSVASQLQAQLAQQIAAAGGDASTAQVTVTSVVSLSDTDSTGAGLAAASFPMMLGGMLGGVLVSLLVVGAVRRLAALAGFAVTAGLLITLVMQGWFEYLQGDFWLNALAIGLSVLATSSFVVGWASLLGSPGIGIGAVVTVLFANPLSAASTPWQFLAQPWGQIGQFFVPGASNWLIRSLSYFPAADDSQQWWTLIGWVALGVVLTLIGHFRARATMHVPPATLEAATA